jgi:hypothetical protein
VEQFKLWGDEELEYSKRLLAEDQRNNSAWNYRYFIISNTTGFKGDDVIKREIESVVLSFSSFPFFKFSHYFHIECVNKSTIFTFFLAHNIFTSFLPRNKNRRIDVSVHFCL